MFRKALLLVLITPQLLQANCVTDFFSPENDPYMIRAVSVVTVIGGAGAYLVNFYLRSPRRIRNKYKGALAFYRANKNEVPNVQYKKFSIMFSFSPSEIKKDADRLLGQKAADVQELRQSLLELKNFVYHVKTYLLENKLQSDMKRLERVYGDHINAEGESRFKKLILGATSSRYPYTNFEERLNNEIYLINKSYSSLSIRSDGNKKILSDAKNLIQKLGDVRSFVRSIFEFRKEQKERKLEHQREAQARERERLEREKVRIEREKLKIKREKIAAELIKEKNPTVVINNNNNSGSDQGECSPCQNPYFEEGYHDEDGYHWPN